MAEKEEPVEEEEEEQVKKLLCSYIGVSFSVFLVLAPKNWTQLHKQAMELSGRLAQAEEQLGQMRSRRKEDSKANARVVEIFASHRNAWQAEEKWLLHQIDAANQEIAHLNARIAEFEKAEDSSRDRMDQLEKEIAERDEMIGFMSRQGGAEFEDRTEVNLGDGNGVYEQIQQRSSEFESEFLASASKLWAERATLWQV